MDKAVHLFRHLQSREGLFIARELADIMGYNSLGSIMRKTAFFCDERHMQLLIGKEMRLFKQYLREVCNIHTYNSSTKILLITESGFYLLMSYNCNKDTIVAGDWIIQCVLPEVKKNFKDMYKTEIYSDILANKLTIILHNGRVGFLAKQLVTYLGNGFNYIHIGYHSYIENIHLKQFDTQKILSVCPKTYLDSILLYESGLYRYLHCISNEMSKAFSVEFQQKILPLLRQTNIHWEKVSEEKISLSKENSLEKMYSDVGEWQQQLQQGIIRENVVISARMDGFMKFFRDLIPLLEERFSNLQRSIEKIEIPQRIPSPKIYELKKLAKKLKIFHMDKKTPHILFVKALLKYMQSNSEIALENVLEYEFAIVPGENWIKLHYYTYNIWKD